MTDLVLFVLLGLIGIAMTVFGGYVSSSNRRHQIAFSAMGILSAILCIAVGIRSYHSQQNAASTEEAAKQEREKSKEREAKLQRSIDAAQLSMEYMRGQLDSVTKVAFHRGEEAKILADAIGDVQMKIVALQAAPRESLKRRALQLSKDVLEFLAERDRAHRAVMDKQWAARLNERRERLDQAAAREAFIKGTLEITQVHDETMSAYRSRFASRALAILDEMGAHSLPVDRLLLYAGGAVNPLMVRDVALGIGTLAEKLR
jgi:hypothetical protein